MNLVPIYGRKVTNTTELNERCGQEATQADVDDEATLDDFNDRAGDDLVGFLLGLDVAPRPLVLSTLLREKEATLFVLHREHEGFDDLAHDDHFAGIDVVADAELTARDTPSLLYPMSSRTSSLSILTTVPLTIWPSSTSTIVPAMASSKDMPRSSEMTSRGV